MARIANKILFCLFFGIIAYVIIRLNFYTHLAADDFYCYFVAVENSPASMGKILWDFYFNWSGRVFLHALAYIFFCGGVDFFHGVNAAGYLLLLALILFHGCYKKFLSPVALVFANLSLFMCAPAFGEDFLWLMGACNYLWGIVIVLAFLVPFRLQIEREADMFARKKLAVLAMFFFGWIAAAANENTSVALVAMILGFMYFIRRKSGQIFEWESAGFVGAVVGTVFLLSAPGNFSRLSSENGGWEIDVARNFTDITALFADPEYLLFPLVCAAVFACFAKGKGLSGVSLIYCIGLVVSMYAMAGSPYYVDRAKLASLVFAVILALCFYGKIEFKLKLTRVLVGIFAVFLIGVSVFEMSAAVRDVRDFSKAEEARIKMIMREKDADEVVLEENTPRSRYVACFKLVRITKDKNAGINAYYARYYGAKAVRVR